MRKTKKNKKIKKYKQFFRNNFGGQSQLVIKEIQTKPFFLLLKEYNYIWNIFSEIDVTYGRYYICLPIYLAILLYQYFQTGYWY